MMNVSKSLPVAGLRGLRAAATALVFALVFQFATAQEVKFPVLKTKTGEYTNVTVTSKTATEVYIMHDGGVQNIKVVELEDETKELLGYELPRDRKKEMEEAAGQVKEKMLSYIPQTTLAEGEEESTESGPESLGSLFSTMSWSNVSPGKLSENIGALTGFVIGYLLYVLCLRVLCVKAGCRPGFLVFIPVFQFIPVFRAAGMGSKWFAMYVTPLLYALALIAAIPVLPQPANLQMIMLLFGGFALTLLLNLIAHIMWCVRIVKARGMSGWVSFFLIFPFTSSLAFLYLLIAPGVESKEDSAKSPPPLPESGKFSGKFVVGGARA